MTGPCCGASAYANRREGTAWYAPAAVPLLPRVMSATMLDQLLSTDDMKPCGVSRLARGVAVSGSLSSADAACVAMGASMQSKK
jgi:hypothetical protein